MKTQERSNRAVLKGFVGSFLVIALGMIAFLIYYAIAFKGGLMSWIVVAIWSFATVLILGVIYRDVIRQRRAGGF